MTKITVYVDPKHVRQFAANWWLLGASAGFSISSVVAAVCQTLEIRPVTATAGLCFLSSLIWLVFYGRPNKGPQA